MFIMFNAVVCFLIQLNAVNFKDISFLSVYPVAKWFNCVHMCYYMLGGGVTSCGGAVFCNLIKKRIIAF